MSGRDVGVTDRGAVRAAWSKHPTSGHIRCRETLSVVPGSPSAMLLGRTSPVWTRRCCRVSRTSSGPRFNLLVENLCVDDPSSNVNGDPSFLEAGRFDLPNPASATRSAQWSDPTDGSALVAIGSTRDGATNHEGPRAEPGSRHRLVVRRLGLERTVGTVRPTSPLRRSLQQRLWFRAPLPHAAGKRTPRVVF